MAPDDSDPPEVPPEDAEVRHVFLFKCRECHRVAPEGRWVLHDNRTSVRATNIRAYPTPECPDCGSQDIDMDHGFKFLAEDDPEPAPWTAPHDHDGDPEPGPR